MISTNPTHPPMKANRRKTWHWLEVLLNRLLLRPERANAHSIRGIQARFILARPGAGSLARLAAERTGL